MDRLGQWVEQWSTDARGTALSTGAVAFAGEPMGLPLSADGAAIAQFFARTDAAQHMRAAAE